MFRTDSREPRRIRNRAYTADAEPGDMVVVAGQVHEVCNLGGIAFPIPRDTPGEIQVKSEKDEMDDDLVETGLGVHREGVISVTGEADEELRVSTGVEVMPKSLNIIAEVEAQFLPNPSGKVDAELLARLNNRALDLRKDGVKATFEIRAEVQRVVRDKFRGLRVTEINTPKIVATGTEGGAKLSPIIYFGQEAFMSQSPQLSRQLMVGSGPERVFGTSPIFHAEEHDTSRHLNEATFIDLESAFIDRTEAVDVCEAVATATYEATEGSCQDELEAPGLEEGFETSLGELPRLTYEEVTERINATSELDEQLAWDDDLLIEGGKAFDEDVGGYYFITDWLSKIEPSYIGDHDDDETLLTDFDMIYPDMEFVSGDQCEHRFDHLVAGSEQQGLDPDVFEYYTEVFKYGIPPHAGFGLGGERLIMTMLGLENIRGVAPFPRDRQRLSPQAKAFL